MKAVLIAVLSLAGSLIGQTIGPGAPTGLASAPANPQPQPRPNVFFARNIPFPLNPTPQAGQTPLPPATVAIIAGGKANYTDTSGQVWTPDSSTPNVAFACTGNTNTYTVTATISGTQPTAADQALYNQERYGPCTWTFSKLANASYTVLMKYSENYWTAAGQRIFNVALNGTAVLTAFDIFAKSGGEFKAIDQSFVVAVTNGTLTVGNALGAANVPKVDSIALYAAPPSPPPTPPGGGVAQVNATPGTLVITGTDPTGKQVQITLATATPFTETFTPNAHSVTLTWMASTSTQVGGYAVYRSNNTTPVLTSAAPLAVVTGLTYVDTAVLPGQTYFYVVTALAPGCPNPITTTTPPCGQSLPSNQVQAVVPTP